MSNPDEDRVGWTADEKYALFPQSVVDEMNGLMGRQSKFSQDKHVINIGLAFLRIKHQVIDHRSQEVTGSAQYVLPVGVIKHTEQSHLAPERARAGGVHDPDATGTVYLQRVPKPTTLQVSREVMLSGEDASAAEEASEEDENMRRLVDYCMYVSGEHPVGTKLFLKLSSRCDRTHGAVEYHTVREPREPQIEVVNPNRYENIKLVHHDESSLIFGDGDTIRLNGHSRTTEKLIERFKKNTMGGVSI